MRVARIAVLAVAVGAGAVAWMMSRSLVADEGEGTVVVQQTLETENVLVAARDIQPGHMISSADLKWEVWPRDAVNAAFVNSSTSPKAAEALAGSVTRASFVKGEPIRSSKIVRAGQGGYLSAVLPSGMRAVATRTSPQTGAGGFILPNDRVDVILTRTVDPAGGGEGFISERVLENVRVLAIDQTVEEQNGKMVVVGNVATLELKPEQTEILALAEQLGDISLALRSIMDGAPDAEDGPISAGNLLGGRQSGTVGMVKFGVPSRVNVN